MKAEKPISTVAELLNRLGVVLSNSAHGGLAAFRGHSDASWKVEPGIARAADPAKAICRNPDDENDRSFERRVLRVFPDHAHPHLPAWFFLGSGVEVKWRTIAIAQHYRLPTRLLDWSTSPLIALYFAVVGEPSLCSCKTPCEFRSDAGHHHAAVHVLKDCDTFSIASLAAKNPSPPLYTGPKDPGLIRPPDIDGRIMAQGSLFSISKNPADPIQVDDTIVIDAEQRKNLLRELDTLGVNRRTVFPGLDSVSEYLTWTSQFWKDDPGYRKAEYPAARAG